jgi:hypothetical protein
MSLPNQKLEPLLHHHIALPTWQPLTTDLENKTQETAHPTNRSYYLGDLWRVAVSGTESYYTSGSEDSEYLVQWRWEGQDSRFRFCSIWVTVVLGQCVYWYSYLHEPRSHSLTALQLQNRHLVIWGHHLLATLRYAPSLRLQEREGTTRQNRQTRLAPPRGQVPYRTSGDDRRVSLAQLPESLGHWQNIQMCLYYIAEITFQF